MDTFMQSQIFFFISAVGFVLLWILAAIFLFYLIRIAKTFSRMMDKLEKSADKIGNSAEDLIEDIRDNAVFRLLFGRSKNKKNGKQVNLSL